MDSLDSKSNPKKRTKNNAPPIKDPSGGLQLAVELFARLPHGVWGQSLEDSYDSVYLAAGTQQEWSMLFPSIPGCGIS